MDVSPYLGALKSRVVPRSPGCFLRFDVKKSRIFMGKDGEGRRHLPNNLGKGTG